MTTLKCSECGYDNEPERVYCHNCGQKLDRSLLPKEDPATVESVEKKQERLRKMVNPSRPVIIPIIKALVTLLALAALVAAVVQAARAPGTLPQLTDEQRMNARPIDALLDDAFAAPAPNVLTFSEQDINAYLGGKVRAKKDDPLADYVKFGTIFVDTKEGGITVGMSQFIFGFPVYLAGDYTVSLQNAKVSASNVGGSIGRLPIHPLAAKYVTKGVFGKVWKALKSDQGQVAQCAGIEFHPDRVVVQTKPQR